MAMETLSITEAKNRFTEIADRAAAEHDHFTVTRNGRPHVMVVSVAEWDELQETIAVLTDPEARADLAESAEGRPTRRLPGPYEGPHTGQTPTACK
jgi:antitoxin YefM